MTDPYASEADTLALIRRDQRSDVEKKLDAMLDERGAWEMESEPFLLLRQITLEQMTTIESIKQAITDPENQPSQFGTVTMEYMQSEIAAEREACAKVAGWLWQQFQDTKDAHERNTMEPFKWGQFGFDQSTVQQSKRMMDAIRARGQA